MTYRVLIVCTANSARSQMAEGLLRRLGGDKFEVFSAGAIPSQVNPFAIQAMSERGIDISKHISDSIERYLHQSFDYVITVCDKAAETCPVFPGKAERIHWSFPDPAAVAGDDAEVLASFIQVRNGLEEKLAGFIAEVSL